MTPTLEELAEDTAVHLLPRQGFDQIDRGDYVFEAGPLRAAVHRIRLGDVAAAVAWTREECRRRGRRDGRMVGRLARRTSRARGAVALASGSSPR